MHRSKKIIRKLTKSGKYVYYIVIPKEFLEELHWKERQKLVVQKIGRGLSIKDWKRKKKR